MNEQAAVTEQQPLATGSEQHRLDVEGMRAIAVGLVILYHAGVPFMPGGYVGVDVFFVLSGFLITGLLVREMERRGTVDLARFYARRIRRLLPAAALTLFGVVVISLLMLPQIRWRGVSGDVIASALYVVNWRFAAEAVDYLAADNATSPVQHFWSLAVEEQFYFVWPFLLLAVTGAARKARAAVRRPLLIALLAVAVPSLAWSIIHTAGNPGSAYFVTTTRMWELAIGGGLAILAPGMARIPRRIAEALAWLGLLGIIVSAVWFDETTLFPGYLALLPVLGAAAVVAAGTAHDDTIAARLLGWRPLVVVGGLSYALYLWHWPLLVGADAMWGELSVGVGLAVAIGAIIPAWLSHRYVEQPVRRSSWIITPSSRGLVFGLGLTVVGVVAGLWLWQSVPTVDASEAPPPTVAIEAPSDTVTVATLPPIEVQDSAPRIYPDPLVARDDLPSVYGDGCHQKADDSDPVFCTYGVEGGPVVALVGNSHAAQWVPSLQLLAAHYGFELRTYTKSACEFAAVDQPIGDENLPYESCDEWNAAVVDELVDVVRPALVVTSGRFWGRSLDESGELRTVDESYVALADGLTERWQEITDAGLALVAFRDVPYPRFDVPECVDTHRTELGACAFDRAAAMDGNTAQVVAAERVGIDLIDLTDRICGVDECPAVVGDLLVWRDKHHLTATYAESLTPMITMQFEAWPGAG